MEKRRESASQTTHQLKAVLSIALVSGLLLSKKLWFSDRLFPLSPVFEWLSLPATLDWFVFGCMIGLCLTVLFVRKPLFFLCVLNFLCVFLVLFDQSRLQPWFYQYVFMNIALTYLFFNPSDDKTLSSLHACRVVLCGIYFWAGIEKLNYSFMTDMFPWFFQPFFSLDGSKALVRIMALLVPATEIGIALSLLTPRFRKTGIIAAIVMHAIILISIGPFGHNWNSIVWPWNIAMAIFVWVLFRNQTQLSPNEILSPRTTLHSVALLLFGILPLFSFFGLWDSYLSFKLYSGNTSFAVVKFFNKTANVSRAPGSLEELSLTDWSLAELNVPVYPEVRIYKNIARKVCDWMRASADVNLVILGSPDPWNGYRPQTDLEVCRRLDSK